MAAALAALGLEMDEEVELEEPFYLWPDNLSTFRIWLSVQTQWRKDGGRPTGLDYSGVETCLRLRGVKKSQWGPVFDVIQDMEIASLNVWAEQK